MAPDLPGNAAPEESADTSNRMKGLWMDRGCTEAFREKGLIYRSSLWSEHGRQPGIELLPAQTT
jgi:hypothetical protein